MKKQFGPFIVSVGKYKGSYAYRITHEDHPCNVIKQNKDHDDFYSRDATMGAAIKELEKLCDVTKIDISNGGYDIDEEFYDE